jgi:pyruvate carboxylase
VYDEYYKHRKEYGDVTEIPTTAFFYPLQKRNEILVGLRKGKEILIRLVYVSDADEEGMRTVVFQLNGGNRSVKVKDNSAVSTKAVHQKVTNASKEVGAPLQGSLSTILVKEGDEVASGAPLFIIEAMKMESTVTATVSGKVKRVVLSANTMVDQNDLVVEFE